MTLRIDEPALLRRLSPLLDDADFRTGLENLANDRFFLCFFLASVSQGEGLGEEAVGMIGEDDLANRIHELERQQLEERGHKEQTLEVARDLFPEFFEGRRYRYDATLQGQPYYVKVLQENRARLRACGRLSRLNLYLTTTFGYEIMVLLLYEAVAEAVSRSRLAAPIAERVGAVLRGILAEEETHLGVVDQHRALLELPGASLSDEARRMLESLRLLEIDDYTWAAELSVREVVGMMGRYADVERQRAELLGAAMSA